MPAAQGVSLFRVVMLFVAFTLSLKIMSGIAAAEFRAPNGTKLVGFRAVGESYGWQYQIPLKRADVLILAGDVLPVAPQGESTPWDWYQREYAKLDEWLGSYEITKSFDHKIVIWGDHDLPRQCHTCNTSFPTYSKDTIPRLSNARVLFDETTTVEGLTVYGTSWQSQNPTGAFYQPRGSQALFNKWNLIPQSTDVIVTHCPPYGMGDGTKKGFDYKVPLYGNTTETLLGYEHAYLTLAGMEVSEEESAAAARTEAILMISERLKKGKLSHAKRSSDSTVSSAALDKVLRLLRNSLGDALLRYTLSSRTTRLIITSQIAKGQGPSRHQGIPIINPSFTDDPLGGNAIANRLTFPKMPVFWSLYGPQAYHPQKDGIDVPFIIE